MRKWILGTFFLAHPIWLESHLTGHWLSTKNALFSVKTFFLWLVNTGVKPPFFKISRLKLQKLLNSCWPSELSVSYGKLSVELFLSGLPHIVKSHLWSMGSTLNKNPVEKWTSCQTWISRSPVITSTSLETTTINNLDGSTLEDNLIASHQEHFVAIS